MNQRQKDIDHWHTLPPEESHSETFADGAEFGRKQERKALAKRLYELRNQHGSAAAIALILGELESE